MFKAIAHLESVSPYSPSRMHDTPKLEKERPDDYERRTWREKAHANDNGNIFLPPMGFKLSLAECAKFLGEQIPGKGKATWTKHFEAGVLCMEPLVLPDTKEAIHGEWFNMNADGKRGSGTRVRRCFPVIPEWKGAVNFYVIDNTITEKVFEHHISEAGKFIGVGRFRPRNGGFYGRFKLVKLEWQKAD
jgi:hypothetical protein